MLLTKTRFSEYRTHSPLLVLEITFISEWFDLPSYWWNKEQIVVCIYRSAKDGGGGETTKHQSHDLSTEQDRLT